MKRLGKILKRLLVSIVVLVAAFSLVTFIYMKQAKFGQLPSGERLERIKKSPNYKGGRFVNQIERPTLTEGHSMLGEAYKTLFKKHERRVPVDSLPSVKTDLKKLAPEANVVVWFGHSSAYMQLAGRKILIDPVFSGSASPIPGSVKAYKGSDIYTVADLPEIDYLIISHDHYDHLDYKTIMELRHKLKHVVCGLGVGAHFERWGYAVEQLMEKDWYESMDDGNGFVIHTLPTHHDGGRSLTRGKSLWLSFVLEAGGKKIYYSGDGGYDPVFKETGKLFGPIDFALMECGQYNVAWQSVHKLPAEVVQATLDIQAKRMMPVHHSKFTLAMHSWDDPLKQMSALSQNQPYALATPMIGELVNLDDPNQTFSKWWEGVK